MDGKKAEMTAWRTAKQCESGACVGVGTQDEFVLVCWSEHPYGGHIAFRHGGWRVFVARVKDGDFDGPGLPVRRPSA